MTWAPVRSLEEVRYVSDGKVSYLAAGETTDRNDHFDERWRTTRKVESLVFEDVEMRNLVLRIEKTHASRIKLGENAALGTFCRPMPMSLRNRTMHSAVAFPETSGGFCMNNSNCSGN
jgi:hypothetical protein